MSRTQETVCAMPVPVRLERMGATAAGRLASLPGRLQSETAIDVVAFAGVSVPRERDDDIRAGADENFAKCDAARPWSRIAGVLTPIEPASRHTREIRPRCGILFAEIVICVKIDEGAVIAHIDGLPVARVQIPPSPGGIVAGAAIATRLKNHDRERHHPAGLIVERNP